MSLTVDNAAFRNDWYQPGRGAIVRVIWYFVNALLFQSYLLPLYGPKRLLLRLFGARVGRGLVIKPNVNIKYPWLLSVGDYVWIGEGVWIDNLVDCRIADSVCLSQGAMLLTGNHDYTRCDFALISKGIILEHGVWIGARSTVCPGVTCGSHAVLSVGSVATKDLDAFGIYRGIPAIKVRERLIRC